MKKIFILLFVAFCLSSCAKFHQWQTVYPDNMIEEIVEDFIKDKADIDIDLTPITGPESEFED